ncbi:MAG: hypothetical protein ACQEXJ_04100 [Myxococcota bacterium]
MKSFRYICEQGMNGHHHLFDRGVLRAAIRKRRPDGPWVDREVADETHSLIDALESSRDVRSQRARIREAPVPVQEVLVHLYFDYLYRYMERRQPILH